MAKIELWDKQLNIFENLACAWPIILVGFGGALGGLCGAGAWYLNVKVMKSDYISLITFPAVIIIGLASWGLYLAAVFWLMTQYPDVFAR